MSMVQSPGNAKAVLSTMAALAASSMLIRSLVNEFLPTEVLEYFSSTVQNISRCLSSQITIVIEEFRGFSQNEVFEAATLYLGRVAASSFHRVKVGKDDKEKAFAVAVDVNEEVIDVFEKVMLRWGLVSMEVQSSSMGHFRGGPGLGNLNAALRSEVRSYELTFHKKHKDMVFNSYLPFVMKKSRSIQEEIKAVKLYTTDYNGWNTHNAIVLDHPMTFRTLTIDPELKKMILEDLDIFINGEEYYRSIGKAWIPAVWPSWYWEI
ncbi:AAA-ATPase At3g50940-like [Punica granatum]|uniref:AAA-ATPase At3g50940-like n=1 Tax=Punica granatum TaxID=22663 RepID=A0A6P8D1L3_PUNGR|nr:AAA-ATPase At3g50940-like [Punica granatum]